MDLVHRLSELNQTGFEEFFYRLLGVKHHSIT